MQRGKTMTNKKFAFFESYYDSFKELPPEIVGKIVIAMCAFYFENTESDLGGIEKSIYSLIKPVLENSKHISETRSEASKGHGAPEGNTNACKEEKQTKTNKNKQTTNKNQTNDKQKQTDKEYGIGNKEKDYPSDNPKRKSSRFVPPTLEEVKVYCIEQAPNVDADAFYKYFTEGNWIDSKGNPVKNWKQKILTWNKFNGNIRASPTDKPVSQKFHNFQERSYDFDDLEKRFARN